MIPKFAFQVFAVACGLGSETKLAPSINAESVLTVLATKECSESTADQSLSLGDADDEAKDGSPQFLGINRTGVTDDRQFEVPVGNKATVLWDQPIGDGWSSFSVVGDRAVTMEQRGDQECVSCYRLRRRRIVVAAEHHG